MLYSGRRPEVKTIWASPAPLLSSAGVAVVVVVDDFVDDEAGRCHFGELASGCVCLCVILPDEPIVHEQSLRKRQLPFYHLTNDAAAAATADDSATHNMNSYRP